MLHFLNTYWLAQNSSKEDCGADWDFAGDMFNFSLAAGSLNRCDRLHPVSKLG
ncbi:hypothetical protein [Calothrix sp. NIES-2100]|uniref:hypothetical protein n=1 Tax=Calothrix sp. NIES-2100 TaxID=1954172 RepID=UPI0030DA32A5